MSDINQRADEFDIRVEKITEDIKEKNPDFEVIRYYSNLVYKDSSISGVIVFSKKL